MHHQDSDFDQRVLIHAPQRRDAPTVGKILGDAGIGVAICHSMQGLWEEFGRGMGAALITEESLLSAEARNILRQCLDIQPAWSEPPLLIITSGAMPKGVPGVSAFSGLANTVYLERPLRTATLVSAVRAALLARRRQIQVRDYLRLREESETRLKTQESELRRLATTLEQRVQQRTVQFEETNRQLLDEMERRQKAEQALLHAQKMEAIGQLTGGIAHDFNNLLMAVSSGVELLERAPEPEKRARILAGIRQAADRGKTLTQQLLAFSRRMELAAEPVQLGRLLESMNVLVTGALRGDIEVKIEVPADLWPLMADATQLELAVLNLVVNARDAMPHGGVLLISAANVTLAEKDGLNGLFVALTVADTGAGIAPEIIHRIFDPFFTTKAVGKGTGLGLSQVYGFVKQSGGEARVESVPGEGTRITLYLPRAKAAALHKEANNPFDNDGFDGDGRRVLVVEDNDDVAALVCEMLATLGFEAERVANAQDAISRLARDRNFDLVLSDIVMPGGMSGLELARVIQQKNPGLPLVLVTGYSEALKDGQRLENVPVLHKPYSLKDLGATLRDLCGPANGNRLN